MIAATPGHASGSTSFSSTAIIATMIARAGPGRGYELLLRRREQDAEAVCVALFID
jgi:hypothetical protein